jgi:hypothetical protein
MDKEVLKRFVLDEFKKEVPQEIATDETKVQEFISKNLDDPLLDKLMEEFCAKNPDDEAVLNVFTLSDEEINEINKNTEKAIADGTIKRIKYEQIINHAGLGKRSADFRKLVETLF